MSAYEIGSGKFDGRWKYHINGTPPGHLSAYFQRIFEAKRCLALVEEMAGVFILGPLSDQIGEFIRLL